jgi:hypothetical protein
MHGTRVTGFRQGYTAISPQVKLGHTVAAAGILLRTTNSICPIVIPNFGAIVPEPKVRRRNVRHKIMIVYEPPVIRKHKI